MTRHQHHFTEASQHNHHHSESTEHQHQDPAEDDFKDLFANLIHLGDEIYFVTSQDSDSGYEEELVINSAILPTSRIISLPIEADNTPSPPEIELIFNSADCSIADLRAPPLS